jgi:hypothetical protein
VEADACKRFFWDLSANAAIMHVKHDVQENAMAPKTQIEQLHDRLDDKFDQIALLIAQRLGFQTPLSNADRKKASEEAEQAIERWDKDAEMAALPPEPATPLQQLFHEHHEIQERILDFLDESKP